MDGLGARCAPGATVILHASEQEPDCLSDRDDLATRSPGKQYLEDPGYIIQCARRGCGCQCDMGGAQAFDSTECSVHSDNGVDDNTVSHPFGEEGLAMGGRVI